MEFKRALSHTILLKSINTVCNFAINLLIVRLLGVVDSGRFFYAISILALVNLVVGICLEIGITYYASKFPGQIKKMSIAIFFLLLIQGLISLVVLSILPIPFSNILASLFVVSYMAINYFTALFAAQKQYIIVNFIPVLVNSIFLLWLSYCFIYAGAAYDYTNAHFLTFFIGAIVLQAIILIGWFFIFPTTTVQDSAWRQGLGKKILRFSLLVFAGNLIYFLVLRIDYYFTERFCDAVAFSNYIQVSKIGQMLLLVPSMAATVIFPYAASGEKNSLRNETIRSLRIFLVLFIVFALLLTVGGYWLFPWLFGNAFSQMYFPMILLLPGIFCLTMMTILAAYLDGIKKLWYPIVGNLIALITISILDYLFIPIWGIKAAAIISSVGYFLCTSFTCYWFLRFSGARLADLFRIERNDFLFIFNK